MNEASSGPDRTANPDPTGAGGRATVDPETPSHHDSPAHSVADDSPTDRGLRTGDEVDGIEDAWRRERPGTPVESIGVITRIRRLAKRFEDERRRTLTSLGIDPATLDLLSTLRRTGHPYQLSPGEIADRALVTAGAVSQRVARAERDGLIERVRHPGDARTVRVTLTAAGHALIEAGVDDLLRHEESLLAPLDGDERAQLASLLRTLLTGLERPL